MLLFITIIFLKISTTVSVFSLYFEKKTFEGRIWRKITSTIGYISMKDDISMKADSKMTVKQIQLIAPTRWLVGLTTIINDRIK